MGSRRSFVMLMSSGTLLLSAVVLVFSLAAGPVASPAATAVNPGVRAIVTSPPAGSQLVLSGPAFSPDGTRIACTLRASNREAMCSQPVLIETSNWSAQAAQVPDFVGSLTSMEWSPDSQSLAFCLINPASHDFEPWVLDTRSAKAHVVAGSPADAIVQEPRFSRDSNMLLAHNSPSGGLLLYDLKRKSCESLADAGGVTRLGYCWGVMGDIWYVRPGRDAGTDLVKRDLLSGYTSSVGAPWAVYSLIPAPDGRNLACVSDIGNGYYALGYYDCMTQSFHILGVVFGAGTNPWAAWAPSGKEIAYECEGRVHVAAIDGSVTRAVSPVGVRASQPFWSPKDGELWCVIDERALAVLSDGKAQEMFSVRTLETQVTTTAPTSSRTDP